jgi:hypothetical protein
MLQLRCCAAAISPLSSPASLLRLFLTRPAFIFHFSCRPLHCGFNLMLWLVSKDIHLAATFARKFYWTDLNL